MYRDLSQQARSVGLVATYWADDITISGANVRPHVPSLIETIRRHGHAVRNRKVVVQTRRDRQEVTGLVVNRRVNVPRTYYESVRKAIVVASFEPSITQVAKASLDGRIRYVAHLNPDLGRVLQLLAAERLPSVNSPGVRAHPEWRQCDGKRCRAHEPAGS
jgi:hypothetical protein